MARFLFASWPYCGCSYPQFAVARALRNRGHQAGFYTGSRASKEILSQGYEHFPFNRRLAERVDSLLLSPDGVSARWPNIFRRLPALREFLCDTVPWQVEDLVKIVRDWRPHAIVCEPAMYAPFLIVRETTGVPIAILEYSFCGLDGEDAPPMGFGFPPPTSWRARIQASAGSALLRLFGASFRRACSEHRQRFGLPPLSGTVSDLCSRLPLILVPSCPEFDYNRRDLPPSVHYVGACLWYPNGEPSPWLAGLERNRPWVHVTEGTLYPRSPVLLQAAAEGLKDLPMQVIIATGWQRSQESLGLSHVADNVIVKPWVGYPELLPLTDLVVTIGGGGTVLNALSAGIPLVVVPMMWDHPENAQRVVEAGVGVRLSPRRCTPGRLREAVTRVLDDPSYRKRAAEMACHLKRYAGPPRAAELLEQLADVA